MRKKDIFLILLILLFAAIFYMITLFHHTDAGYVLVYVDGNLLNSYPLDIDTEVTISGYQGGYNTLVIKDGKADITDADCPDRLCVKQESIYRTGETLICLPHRIVIQIAGSEEKKSLAPDAVAN